MLFKYCKQDDPDSNRDGGGWYNNLMLLYPIAAGVIAIWIVAKKNVPAQWVGAYGS